MEGFFEYRNPPSRFKLHFKNKLACESHKLDGDIDVRTGAEFVENRVGRFIDKNKVKKRRSGLLTDS